MSIDVAALRNEVKVGQEALHKDYVQTNDTAALLANRCRMFDGILTRL